ncbi:hypothetical protein Tco_0078792 [Tanacetum coccineum]
MASNNFGHTASSRVINDGTTSFAQCGSGKNILISEKTIRVLTYSLMTAHGVDCFPKAAHSGILDSCIIHCLSPKSTSWSNLESTSASAYRIATKSEVQLFFDDNEWHARTYLQWSSQHWQRRRNKVLVLILELRVMQGMLKVPLLTVLLRCLSPAQDTANVQGTATSQRTADVQGTADFQDMAEPHGAANIPKSPNDYTPQIVRLKKIWGDEGLLDLYALNREVRRLKKQTLSQAKLIRKLKAKLKNLSKVVAPVVKHHAFWVESQHLAKQKEMRKKQKKKIVLQSNWGRNKGRWALETSNDGEVAKKVSREWDAEVEKEKVGRIEREQAKVLFPTTSLLKKENQMNEFLKGTRDT